MRSGQSKLLLITIPFLFFLISVIVIAVLVPTDPGGLDQEWSTRAFVLSLIIFSGLMLIPDLLHLRLVWRGSRPRIWIELSHHSPSLRRDHEVLIRGVFVCVGCFGSFLGLLAAELIFLSYLITPLLFSSFGTFPLILFGVLLLILSYSRYLLFLTGYVRLIQHGALFLGLSFLVLGSDQLFGSALALVLLLPTWISFLLTRLFLSRIEHRASF
ncbi:MAG: hypothetical protein ACFFFG_00345 [Candidatus Thorarchaeota archaeon]